MNTLKIEVPEGYEIDTEKSTFEEIVFKPVKKQLPKSWEELGEIDGWFVTADAIVSKGAPQCTHDYHKNLFSTKDQAKASIALAQLSQLREVYRDGWKPNWNDVYQTKYVIKKHIGELYQSNAICTAHFLAFQSAEINYQFLENCRDLIQEASPLLFG